MHERFLAVNAVRDAVIEGNLGAAKDRAKQLAKDEKLRDPDAVFADWGPHTETMRKEIQKASEAADLGAVAMHTSEAARACGRCHNSLGVATLGEKTGTPPAETENIGGVMRRHQWAVSRMWDGLIAPSDDSWAAGSKAMTEATSHALQQPQVKSDEQLTVLMREADELAKAAATAVTWPERTTTFGQLLSTCSSCHQKMQAGASGQ
ncbi:MAG: hypothetical protein KJO07_16360 [Deltaproteobacteria bacterium]|nr:hypothetical protein [Deltaproteobacteria bacterium]